MLKSLTIKNFGVVKDMTVDFDGGLNIITGETGAGKSLILGALKLLGGERINRDIIRDKSLPVKIEGVFEGDFGFLDADLKEEFEIGNEIIIKRFFDDSGKNKITINGSNASVNQIKNIFSELVEIHGQYENQKLLNSKNHLSYIDSYIKSADYEDYMKEFTHFQQLKKRIRELMDEVEDVNRSREIIEFQMYEIEQLDIRPDEDNLLEEKIKFLSNIEKISESRNNALNNLKYSEINAYDLLADSLKSLENAGKFSKKLADSSGKLNNMVYQLNDIITDLEGCSEEEFDQSYLNALNERKFKLDSLMKKHGRNLQEILLFHKTLKDKLDTLQTDENEITGLNKETDLIEATLKELAERVNAERIKIAETICRKVESILLDLELKHPKLGIKNDFSKILDRNCSFSMEFLISTNLGFEPGPLSKVASGGEISRVMLALKEIFSESDLVETLVFDEIDTGISGVTAKKVADKLKNLATRKQLIVITHLPVVAAKADKHLHILKRDEYDLTETYIQYLDRREREEVVATMIAGSLTDSSRKQAEEMIKEG